MRKADDGVLMLAHGLGGRSDLPVPLWLAMYAGAFAIVVSFFVLAALWTTPKLRGAAAGRPLPALERIADARATRVALRMVGLLLFAVFLVVAWVGPDDAGARNPAPTWLYVWFWVGLVPLSLAFGPIWRTMNPLRTLADVIHPLLRGPARALPPRLAYWPAVAGLAAFLWMELVYDDAASPQAIAVFVSVYAVVHIAAGVAYGPRWFTRADGFEVYAWLVSRASPFGRRDDGRIVLRNPLDNLAATPRSPDLTPVIVVVLGSTAFDGISRTPLWRDLVAGADRLAYMALGTAGLLGALLAVVVTYGLAIRLTRPYLRGVDSPHEEFAHSLIPIAIGYTVAHYLSFAAFQGQQGILLANDPLVLGWNLFGLAGARVDYTLISTTAIALIQIGAIIVGHMVAITSAHDRAVALLPRKHARVGQYPLLAVMVGYTTAGIALLAGA